MIRNERQYRVTKTQARKFEQALREMEQAKSAPEVHPRLHQAQIDALRSQMDDLQVELREYEALQSGKVPVLELPSFQALAPALVKARIARGWSQKQLAEHLGLKEQQIQRYEATDYGGASLARINAVIEALGVRVSERVYLPSPVPSPRQFLHRLGEAGLDRGFALRCLLPPQLSSEVEKRAARGPKTESLVLRAAEVVGRIYEWPVEQILGDVTLALPARVPGFVRFKGVSGIDPTALRAHTFYARYLAQLLLQATPDMGSKPLATDALELRDSILSGRDSLTLDHVLRFVWDLGIPVLPLREPVAFQDACWRWGDRSAVILNPSSSSDVLWIADVVHALYHLGRAQKAGEWAVVDTDAASPQTDEEEKEAASFVGQVILGSHAEELFQPAARKAAVDRNLLGTFVQNIARHRIIRAAAQKPWRIASRILRQQLDLNRLQEDDRELVNLALDQMDSD